MKRLIASGACLLLGTGALWFVLQFRDRVPDLGPRGDNIMAFGAVTCICSYMAALISLASWYGANRIPRMAMALNPGMSEETLRLGVKAGVYGLEPGASYRVIREIKDYYGNIFPVGMELTFVQRNFVPYHGGHTVVFRPRTMYLQDEADYDVVNHLDKYLEAARPEITAEHFGH